MNYETTYDITLLAGIDEFARNWELYKKEFYKFACNNAGPESSWKEQWFRDHMYVNYIDVDTPITARFFSLDNDNCIMVIRYIKECLMKGTAERKAYFL